MSQKNNNFTREKSNRIVLFAYLRDSKDILLNFEKRIYKKMDRQSESGFAYRFIDRVILKNFREPLTLYEILLDNDPRVEVKKNSIQRYSEAYSKYCEKKWREAKEIFSIIYQEYGLGIGSTMAKRCDILAVSPPNTDWDGIWRLKDK